MPPVASVRDEVKLSDSASYEYATPLPPNRIIEVPSGEATIFCEGATRGVCCPLAPTPVIDVPTRGIAWLPTTFHNVPVLFVGSNMTNCKPLRPIAIEPTELTPVLPAATPPL